jgi:primosomal protein N' (replication factor Y)
MHSPHKSAYAQILELSLTQLKQGSTLLLLPDVKDIDRIFELITTSGHSHTVLRLDSSLPRAQRYEDYLEALTMEKVLVIGNRSALFAPVNNLNSIIVGFEKSEQYYEKKHPYWNVRDSALLRAELENINIFFTGYVPSSIISRRIENREIDFIGPRSSLKTFAFPQTQGELLPDRIIPAIRKALVEGTVLFLAPRKGYGNALLCAKCRNISLCSCGGRQILTSSNADPLCSTCGNLEKDWKCKWCDSTTRYVSARGIDRLHEEIGRAFANTRIQLSSAPNILSDVAPNTKIVIATAGSVPGNKEDYSAVVLLEGQRFLAASTTVYEEQVYENFFEAASHVSKKGSVLIVLDHSHPVVAALTRWSPSILVKKILRENVEASLPPYSSIAILTLDKSDAVVLKNGFTKSITDGRLPSQTNVVLVPGQGESQSRVLVSVPIEYRELLSKFLLELSRKRAIAKKSVVNIALDPYTLLT